jgi:hypothetical protein
VGGHLGVLLHHDRGQVGGQQDGDQPGDEEHVDDIEQWSGKTFFSSARTGPAPAEPVVNEASDIAQRARTCGRSPLTTGEPLNFSTSRTTSMDLKVQYNRS